MRWVQMVKTDQQHFFVAPLLRDVFFLGSLGGTPPADVVGPLGVTPPVDVDG